MPCDSGSTVATAYRPQVPKEILGMDGLVLGRYPVVFGYLGLDGNIILGSA